MKVVNEEITDLDYKEMGITLNNAARRIDTALKYGPDMRSSRLFCLREIALSMDSVLKRVDSGVHGIVSPTKQGNPEYKIG